MRNRYIDISATEPIFICGLGRSGTTWLAHSLGQSSELTYIKEAWLIGKLDGLRDWHEMLYSEWVEFTPWHEKGLDRKVFVEHMSQFYRGLLNSLSGNRRFIEKTAEWNIVYLALLNEMFPDAYFPIIYRDGRNYVASLQAKRAGKNQDFDFKEECNRWSKTMSIIDSVVRDKWIRNAMIIRYEDLLRDFDTIFMNICEFCKITPFAAKPNFPNSSFSNYQHISDFNTRWHKWSKSEKTLFKEIAGNQLINWGYEQRDDSW